MRVDFVGFADKHRLCKQTQVLKMKCLGRISLSLSLSLSLSRLVRFLAIEFLKFSTLFARFSLFIRRKFINFILFYGLPRSRKRLLAMTKWQKPTTFINFHQISTQHDFKILKILKNSTQRTSYGDTKRTRFHR